VKELVQKLAPLERMVSQEKGDFSLFGLFLKEDTPDRWDLLVSAPWVEADKGAALRYLADAIRTHLTPEEARYLSRIVIIDSRNPALRAINRALGVEHGQAEVQDSVFFGLLIKHAYIITSKEASSATDTGRRGTIGV